MNKKIILILLLVAPAYMCAMEKEKGGDYEELIDFSQQEQNNNVSIEEDSINNDNSVNDQKNIADSQENSDSTNQVQKISEKKIMELGSNFTLKFIATGSSTLFIILTAIFYRYFESDSSIFWTLGPIIGNIFVGMSRLGYKDEYIITKLVNFLKERDLLIEDPAKKEKELDELIVTVEK